VNRFIWLEVNY